MREHWKSRNSVARVKENPRFHDWLAGLLIPPDTRVLAVVDYADRYRAERSWTITLAAKFDLMNVSFGSAPLKRAPLSAEHKAKISATLTGRRSGPLSPEHRAKISAAHKARIQRLRSSVPPSAAAAA